MKTEIIDYIIKLLLGPDNEALSQYVSYGEGNGKIKIRKSSFFSEGTYLLENSLPKLPFKQLGETPILFGENTIEKKGDTIILGADIIASTFFLVTRYEEYVCKDNRDIHERFLGKGSILYKSGCLERPLVDEYGRLLRNCLRELNITIAEETTGFKHIYLTHDVDQIWQWRSLYSSLKTMVKRVVLNRNKKFESIKARINYKKYDTVYTFPWLIEMDNKIKAVTGQTSSIYFMMGSEQSQRDFGYINEKEKVADLINYLENNGADIGIHIGYEAGKESKKIRGEIHQIEEICKHKISSNRYHYLASRYPQNFRDLLANNITDDFTMGYADVTGFRLGTCSSVRWIDILEEKVTDLVLHPMTVMDVTLDGREYMDLSEEEAYNKVCKLLDAVYEYNGEVILLWHNLTVSPAYAGYQRNLYEKALLYLKDKVIK